MMESGIDRFVLVEAGGALLPRMTCGSYNSTPSCKLVPYREYYNCNAESTIKNYNCTKETTIRYYNCTKETAIAQRSWKIAFLLSLFLAKLLHYHY